jgi:hypothetical protein
MKLGLQNYVIIIPTDNSYIKFNNNKINSLQTYDIAQNYRVLHEVVQCWSQHNFKFQTTTILIGFIKENNDSNKTYKYVHYILHHEIYNITSYFRIA